MKKKILAFILAGTMVMGSCLTAFATEITTANEDGSYSSDITVDADITTPEVNVTVPTSSAVTLNPYKIKTTVGENTDSTDKVVSDHYYIKNESNVAIRVDGKLQVTPATDGKVVLAAGALTGKETTKSALIYLDVQAADSDSDAKTVAAFDKSSTSQILGAKTLTTKTGLITLGEGKTAATYAHYTFGGDVVTTPAQPWSDKDKVEVKLTWVFTPVVPE